MLKVKSCMELEVNGKKYEFYCAPDSPLQDAVEANMQINAFLLGRMEQNKTPSQHEQAPEVIEEQPKEEKSE